MDATMVSLLGLVLGLIVAVVGSFAWLMGEIRKVAARADQHIDTARDYLNGRIEGLSRSEANERASLRSELVNSTGRVETDLRRLSEVVVRRQDVDALETRLSRYIERIEVKVESRGTTTRGFPSGGSS
jgi:hypothetical protein